MKDTSSFISTYTNHPILFIGSGFSLRYTQNSYTWDDLLKHICVELTGNVEKYTDIKTSPECIIEQEYKYDAIATKLEKLFNTTLQNDRNGKFKTINDLFYEKYEETNIPYSRFKLYIASLLQELSPKTEPKIVAEIDEFKKCYSNIGTIITTNYDTLIEELFPNFNPIIGNDILFSTSYGSLYKIHGCISKPESILINTKDYQEFEDRHDLIKAQLISLFLHNPIIFIGYSISDPNIRNLLTIIFSYVRDTATQEKIKNNFLVIEYEKGQQNTVVQDFNLILPEGKNIVLNKISTDNYLAIYRAIQDIRPKVSALDIRKVQSAYQRIIEANNSTDKDPITIVIAEDPDSLKHGEQAIIIGPPEELIINVQAKSYIEQYFSIVDNKNSNYIEPITSVNITKTQYFPAHAFLKTYDKGTNSVIERLQELCNNQKSNITTHYEAAKNNLSRKKYEFDSIDDILSSDEIATSDKYRTIFVNVYDDRVTLDDLCNYLKNSQVQLIESDRSTFNRLITLYDYKKYQ